MDKEKLRQAADWWATYVKVALPDGFAIDTKALERLRKEKMWSRARLGAESGMSEEAVAKYESGDRTPRPEYFAALCRALGVTDPAELLAKTEHSDVRG